MKILGLQKQSLIEYPGKISAVIFLGGCNFRCPFCHVPTLVLPELIETQNEISQEETLSFLEKRKTFLEAVSITGGEPTLNKDLPDFIKKIKSLGFLVQLETNGTNPGMLRKLIEEKLIDYAAMDIKHRLDSFEKHNEITGFKLTKELFENIKESIKILLSNKIDYQFRTTLIKEFHKKEDILEICKEIQGVRVYYLQNYQKENKTISDNIFTPFREEEIEEIIKDCKNLVNIHYRKYL